LLFLSPLSSCCQSAREIVQWPVKPGRWGVSL
jgi:hypothetical protein